MHYRTSGLAISSGPPASHESPSEPIILHLHTQLGVGGIETQLARSLPRLATAHRFSPAVLITKELGPLAPLLEAEAIPVDLVRLHGGRLRPASVRELSRRFRRWQAALVHAHAYEPATTGTIAARLVGVPFLSGIHNDPVLHGIRGWRRRVQEFLLFRLRAGIVCVSERVRRDYLALVPVPEERVHVLYNGLDVQSIASQPREKAAIRAEFGLPPDALVLICVARFVPYKDHDLLLDAFDRIAARHPKACLLLVGSGPTLTSVHTVAEKKRLGPRVVFAGLRSDVPRLLRASDIFVLASRAEGFSNAIVEALAAGLPLVVTDVGGNREAMEGETTGRLVPYGDIEAFARALDELLGNEDLRRRLGAAAARRAFRFDFQRTIPETASLYESVLRSSRDR